MNKNDAVYNIEEALRDSGCGGYSVQDAIDAAKGKVPDEWGWITIKLDYEVQVKPSWIEAAR